jgi:peptidoglycan/LPS O-acetylase OafA/YrhL
MTVAVATVHAKPQTITTAKGRFYRPELDCLRFFAFFAVFIFHAVPRGVEMYGSVPSWAAAIISGAVNAGAFGVDVFFALSAYLITTLLLHEKERTGDLDLRSFYIRRILRIWPLYFAFIGVSVALSIFFRSQHLAIAYVAGYLLLAGNWVYVLYGMPQSVAIPLWTVSIEEQFYLAWPLAARRLSRKSMAVAALAILTAANLSRVALVLAGAPERVMGFNTITRIDAIGMGILLSLWTPLLPDLKSLHRLLLAAVSLGALIAVGMFCGFNDSLHAVNRWGAVIGRPVVALASAALLLSFLGAKSGWLRSKQLTYLGKISYGLYVVHSLGVVIALHILHPTSLRGHLECAAVALGITCALAAISYRWLESPFLRKKEAFAAILSRPV